MSSVTISNDRTRASKLTLTKRLSASMARHARVSTLPRLIATISTSPTPGGLINTRCFSVLNRPPPNYEGHIPLTVTERLGLALGSGLGSFLDPRRGGEHAISTRHAAY